MKKSKRIIALITALAILFSVLFSSVFIIEKSEHNCSGNNCKICSMLQTAKDNLTATKDVAGGFFASLSLVVFFVLEIVSKERKVNSKTLIDLSVKITA